MFFLILSLLAAIVGAFFWLKTKKIGYFLLFMESVFFMLFASLFFPVFVNLCIDVVDFFHSSPPPVTDYFEPLKGGYFTTSGIVIKSKEEFAIKESYERDKIDFELYEHKSDRGFYEYYVWVDTIDTGTVYLKGTYIGKKRYKPLRDLRPRVEMEIHNQSDGFVKCGPKFFAIYDDFNVESYFAKFELWYKPKNLGEKRLLATKIYKVSGTP